MWLFMRTKTGTAMTAVGSNPDYARASGISSDRMRTVSVIMSTVLGAVGIVVFQQSYRLHPALYGAARRCPSPRWRPS